MIAARPLLCLVWNNSAMKVSLLPAIRSIKSPYKVSLFLSRTTKASNIASKMFDNKQPLCPSRQSPFSQQNVHVTEELALQQRLSLLQIHSSSRYARIPGPFRSINSQKKFIVKKLTGVQAISLLYSSCSAQC